MTLRHGRRAPVLLPILVTLRSARRAMLDAAAALRDDDAPRADAIASALFAQVDRELSSLVSSGDTLGVSLCAPVAAAAAYTRLLVDLYTAGWRMDLDASQVYALPPSLDDVHDQAELLASKAAVRGSMVARVRESVASASTARLVDDVEPKIGALMADPKQLAAAIDAHGAAAIQPYLQLARRADGDDEHTGLPLYSIFRYLRFWWSFPYRDTPGRSLPFLIRDAGQPGHPVCGLINLASPVLRMAQRDDALGLTSRWLRECASGLHAYSEGEDALRSFLADLGRRAEDAAGTDEHVVQLRTFTPQLAQLLDVRDLTRAVRREPADERVTRADAAAERVLTSLEAELLAAIQGISFAGLEATLDEALREPVAVSERLLAQGETAAQAWRDGRTNGAADGNDGDRLFFKKRANQLSKLVSAWSGVQSVHAVRDAEGALAALVAATAPGAEAMPALADALTARKVRLLATQVADVSVCGAVPPYNEVLGGKLAASLALSRDAAAAYHATYEGTASEIQSKMAGEEVRRPADLLALTTTSFYSVGSAQYNRLRFPTDLGGSRWEKVGATAGHGTLHLSEALVALVARLVDAARGGKLISARFGEGPSERLRKLRDGLNALGLPSNELLRHGFSRIVYVSVHHELFPGAPNDDYAHYTQGPGATDVTQWWGERWCEPRRERIVAALRASSPPQLLSERFAEELARVSGDAPPTLVDEALPMNDEPDPEE